MRENHNVLLFLKRWAIVGCCIVLFVALRSRGVGHILLGDEAATLCSYRAFAAGGGDHFSGRFWLHPPAFGLFVLLLFPLEPGIAERVEWMAIAVAASSLLMLVTCVRRIYGQATANWAAFFLATMPGPVFFDVWIKSGPFVVLFALCALYAQVAGRFALAALFMGLSFMDKELAVLSAMAMGILALLDHRSRTIKCLGGMAAIIAVTAGWWYIVFSSDTIFFLQSFAGTAPDSALWHRPWYYYASCALKDFGWPGIGMLGAGVVVLGARMARLRSSCSERHKKTPVVYQWWPLLMLIPAYLVLQIADGKSPWLVTSLYPACVTLQAIAAVSLMALVQSVCRTYAKKQRWIPFAASALVSVALVTASLATVVPRSYKSAQIDLEYSIYMLALTSYTAAQEFNRLVTNDVPVLVTSFAYNGLMFTDQPCAVFAYYRRNTPVLYRPYYTPFSECVALITNYRLDWAVVAPEPGAAADNWCSAMKSQFGIVPSSIIDWTYPQIQGDEVKWVQEHAAYIFRTTPLYERAEKVKK